MWRMCGFFVTQFFFVKEKCKKKFVVWNEQPCRISLSFPINSQGKPNKTGRVYTPPPHTPTPFKIDPVERKGRQWDRKDRARDIWINLIIFVVLRRRMVVWSELCSLNKIVFVIKTQWTEGYVCLCLFSFCILKIVYTFFFFSTSHQRVQQNTRYLLNISLIFYYKR